MAPPPSASSSIKVKSTPKKKSSSKKPATKKTKTNKREVEVKGKCKDKLKKKEETELEEKELDEKEVAEKESTDPQEAEDRRKCAKLMRHGKQYKKEGDDLSVDVQDQFRDIKEPKKAPKEVLDKQAAYKKNKEKERDRELKARAADKEKNKNTPRVVFAKEKYISDVTKKRLTRLYPKPKEQKEIKVSREPDLEKALRPETPEEKGHSKVLLDSVYHNMELEIDPDDHIVRKEAEPVLQKKYKSYDEVSAKVDSKVKDIIDTFHQIFQMYKPDEVMLSFNGGKDCTVVLHLLHRFFQMNACLKQKNILTLYITDPDAFEEVDDFVQDCEKLFNIELIKKAGPIKNALEQICKEKPQLKAVLMGCRRTDPFCKDLKVMQTTDAGWPPLMRINPIIDWTCRDVWQYLYKYNVPFCVLYQQGYTSIGNKKDTEKNPYLRVFDRTSGIVIDYRPGHELLDNDELERAGRTAVPKAEPPRAKTIKEREEEECEVKEREREEERLKPRKVLTLNLECCRYNS